MMNSEILFWLEAIIAVFFGMLMLLDYRKYRLKSFQLLFFVFCVLFLKSIFYGLINFTDVKLVESGTLDTEYLPLYNLKYFVFQFFEAIYAIAFSYLFLHTRTLADNKEPKFLNILFLTQLIAATVIAALVIIISVTAGKPETFQTQNGFIEILKSGVGRLLFVIWKMALLVMVWMSITTIYGLTANILRVEIKYKNTIYIVLILEMAFSIFSSIINYYHSWGWFGLQILSILFFSRFAYANHSGFILTLQEKIENVTKEKDIILSLMREISSEIGSGEFELQAVIKTIVENSLKGTGARGCTILIKDKVTNRLSVSYVSGLYPPTKPFKTTHGLALTENVILEKFKAEKIAVGEGLLGKVVETGESLYIPEVTKIPDFEQTIPEFLIVRSLIAVPLKSKEDVFGVLSVVDDTKILLENDLSLLETLSRQATITILQLQMYQEVLEKKRAEKEIEVAAEIQSSLVPHTFPITDRFEIFGFSIPVKGVGGDYYDYIDFGNNKIALAMFDVSGKGVPASLIMVMIRSILRTLSSINEETKEVLWKLNNIISEEIIEDRYATGIYLLFDAEKGIMNYTNAGHGPMILYRSSQDKFEFMDTEGMPVGIMSGAEYGQNYSILEPGDVALLYTDGITEAMNPAHEEFGVERLKEVIKKNRREPAKDIADRVLEAVTKFAGIAPQHDDQTLLILKSK